MGVACCTERDNYQKTGGYVHRFPVHKEEQIEEDHEVIEHLARERIDIPEKNEEEEQEVINKASMVMQDFATFHETAKQIEDNAPEEPNKIKSAEHSLKNISGEESSLNKPGVSIDEILRKKEEDSKIEKAETKKTGDYDSCFLSSNAFVQPTLIELGKEEKSQEDVDDAEREARKPKPPEPVREPQPEMRIDEKVEEPPVKILHNVLGRGNDSNYHCSST